MEPLEFQRDWESRNAAGYPGPPGDVALHDTDPGVRPGSWAPAREGYDDEMAPRWVPEPGEGRARHAAGGPGRPPAQPARADEMFNEPYSGGDWRDDPGYGYDNVGGGAGPYSSGRHASGPYRTQAGYDAGPYGNGAERPGPYDLPAEHPSGPYSPPVRYDDGRYDSGARNDPGPYNASAGYDAGPYGNGAERPGPYDLPAEHPSGPYNPPVRYDDGRYDNGARNDSGPYSSPVGYDAGRYGNGARYDSGPYQAPGPYGPGPDNPGPDGPGPYNDPGPYGTGARGSHRRSEIMLADTSRTGRGQANGRGAHSLDRAYPARDEPALQGYPASRGAVEPYEDPVSLAQRILSVADYEATAITQRAAYQAATITKQVAYEATEIRDAARREAQQIKQEASDQAQAVRQAAEFEVAEVHTAVMSMQTELNEFAARLNGTLPQPALPRTSPAEPPAASLAAPPARPKERPRPAPTERPPGRPVDKPAGRPAAEPVGMPAGRPAARPAEAPAGRPAEAPAGRPAARPGQGPAARPAGRPAAQPAGRPAGPPAARPAGKPSAGKGRQVGAIRFATIATTMLFLVAVVAGVIEIHLHGFQFFVFRATGVGETSRNGLQENQGPGQSDAPKPTPSHLKVQPSPHSTVTVHNG
jgi:hypothetical protein